MEKESAQNYAKISSGANPGLHVKSFDSAQDRLRAASQLYANLLLFSITIHTNSDTLPKKL